MERFFLKNWVVGGLASLLLVVLLSCGEDAGLGASIDTKAPTLSITYPDSGVAIRDSFILAGDCSDDKSISRILVTVKNLESGVDYGSYPAKVSVDQTSWQVELNSYDSNNAEYYNGWQLPDGKYEVSVTAYDNAGNNSGVSSRQFEIDNTPPVFIISNPGVVKSSGLKASAYGSLFTIDGTISDNHPISYMDVKIFRTSDGQLLSHETYEGSAIDFYREEDIATAGGSSVTIAQWSDTATQTAKTRYTDIYGDNEEAGTIEYFAQIALYDSAKVYKNPPKNSSRSAVEVAADVYGNSTSTVYLYDDVYTALMSAKKGLGLSAANLKDILAGLDKGEKATAALSTLSTNAKNTEVDANRLYFSLNPQANPTYNVNGFKFGFGTAETQLASPGNTVSVTVSAGLDNTNIQPELVKVWIKKYDSKPTDEVALKRELEKLNQKVIELTKEETEFVEDVTTVNLESGNDWILVYDYALHNDRGSSVATKTFAVTLPAIKENGKDYIELEKFYILGVTGHDIEEVRFSQNTVYGFEGNASGVPPTFAFDDTPKSLSIWKNFADPKFSGTAVVSSGNYFVKEITAKLTLTDENTNATVGTYTDTMTSDRTNENGVVWYQSAAQALSWDYDANKWKLDLTKLQGLSSVDITNKQLLASLEISGKASTGHSGSASRDIHIDTVAPVVTMTSITPSVSGKEYFGGSDSYTYLNGNITIKGNVEEQNLSDEADSVSYDIWASTDLGKTLDEGDSILEDLKTRKTELGLDSGAADGNFDGNLGKQFTLNIQFDTTAITKLFCGNEEDAPIQVELVFTAKDKAGNTGSYSSKTLLNANGKNYVVYQRTDRPKITLGNASASVTSANGINVNTNLFGTTNNNKLQVSFEDDDSVAEYKIYIYKEDGTTLAAVNGAYGDNNPYEAHPKKTSASINYLLPETEGKYQVKIEARDYLTTPLNSNPYGEETVGNFFIAVDSGAPNITITKPVAGSYQNGTVQVEGTVSKYVDVTITGKLLREDKSEVTGNGTSISQVTIDSTPTNGVYKWTGTVTLPANASGSYTLDYEAKDVYGQKTSTTVGFVVDITPPKFNITVPEKTEVFTADSMYTVKGTISDGKSTSGIKGLYWTITPQTASVNYAPLSASGALTTGWNQIAATPKATKGEYTWIANIELPDDVKDGTASKTVYICVIDEAGNVSKISENAKSNSLKITLDQVAPSTTLLGTGLKKPAAEVTASETGTKDEAGNLILAADSELSESITYYATDATDATNGYKISGVVTEASGVSNVNVKVDGTEVSPDSTGKWTFNGKTTDGTFTHQIVISDKAGNSVTKKISVIRDTTLPTLTVANDTNDSDALNTTKVITEKNTNYSCSESDGKHYYLLSGKWKDTTSGTYKLQYRVAPKHEDDTYSDTWSDWRDISDVTQSTAETSWSVKVPMTEGKGLGSGVALQGRAIDAAGNVFEHEGHSGLKLDFSAPTIAAGSVKKNNTVVTDYKYVKEGETLVIEGTCADSYELDEINVVAKKDGTAVSTGTNGLVIEKPIAADKKTGTFKITLTASDSNNGNWEFEVTAKDWVERESQTLKFSTLVDTVKPEWNASDILVDKKTYTEGTNHSWYKNSTLPFSGSLTENGSGIKEIRYTITKADGTAGDSDSFTTSVQKDASGNVEKETFSTKLGEFLSKKDESGVAQANTVTLVAEDEAGNVSAQKTFKIYIDSESPQLLSSDKSGTQYSNKSLPITVKGTASDDASGVDSVKLTISEDGKSEVKTTVDATSTDSFANWTATIPKDFLSGLEDKTYAVKATLKDKAGNSTSSTIFRIDVDTDKPTIKNVSLSDGGGTYSVYETKEKIDGADKTVYYIHSGDNFLLSGSVQDSKSGIKSIMVNDGTSDIVSKIDGKDVTALPVTLDLSSYASADPVTLKITATDNAGNTESQNVLVKIDNLAPKALHAIDEKQKDVFFRIGENDNDDISSGDSLWNANLDKDVGGKYAEGTYGNSKTIKIRGTLSDTGSGAAMIYYKVISETDLAGVSANKVQEELDKKAAAFLKNYKTDKTGYFAPGVIASDAKRRVFYTGSLKNALGESTSFSTTSGEYKDFVSFLGTLSGSTKSYATVESNYNSVLSGFSTGKNYLILVAVDNVGNAALDSVKVGGKTYSNVSLNVDETTPDASSSVEGLKYTNKTGTMVLSGKASDADSGLYSITLKQGTKEILLKNDATGGTSTNENGTLEITKTDGKDNEWSWTATVNNDKFFAGASGTVSVSLEAKDRAGIGNTKSINVATVIVDEQLDSIILSSPTDADSETAGTQINGTITLEGTMEDTNVLPTNAITRIEYKGGDASDWTDLSTKVDSLELSGSYTFKVEGFDTTKLSDNTEYQIRAVGTDSAGNVKESDAVSIKVSQDSDRPKVNFNNIEYSETLGTFLLKHGTDSQVTGRISDDDATGTAVVKKFIVSETAYTGAEGETEPANLLGTSLSSSGEFTITPSDTGDGEKTFYIYIEDNGGKKFYTTYTSVSASVTTNDKLQNPKILVKNKDQTDWDGKQFVYKSDSLNPTIGSGKGLPYSDEAAASVAKDFSGNAFEISSDNSNLNASFIVGGEDRRYVKFYFTGRDASGISSMSATFTLPDGNTETTSPTLSTGDSWTGTQNETLAEWTTAVVDTRKWGTGQVSVSVTITDRVGNATTGTYSFMVDNAAPTISITKPVKDSHETEIVTISGTAFDAGNADVKSIEWAIPTKKQLSITSQDSLKDTLVWNSYMDTKKTVKSWEFVFDKAIEDLTDEEKTSKEFKSSNPLLDLFDNETYADATDGIYPLHIYFMATDRIGNFTVITDYTINHDPSGDRPQTTFSYPTTKDYADGQDYVTLGGTIRASGQSIIPIGDATVKEVYFQLVEETATSFTKDYVSGLKYTDSTGVHNAYTVVTAADILGTVYTSITSETDATKQAELLRKYGFSSVSDMKNWWGIKANGSASWNFTINEHDELNADGTTNNIKIRVCGVNSNNKFGAWSDTENVIHIHVSSGVPQFTYTVAQFETAPTTVDATPSVVEAYSADMYLKGKWYIIVTATDDSQVKEMSATEGGSVVSGLVPSKIQAATSIKMIVPVSETSGNHSYTVSAKDDTGNTSKMPFSINIDNAAPTLEGITGAGVAFSTKNTNDIQNSNGMFTLAGESDDSSDGSGVKYVAFYYMRDTGTGTPAEIAAAKDKVVFDPIHIDGGDSYSARIKMGDLVERKITGAENVAKVIKADKTMEEETQSLTKFSLWSKKLTGTMSAKDTFESSTALGSHIHEGGLIEIGGVYRKISAISGSTITLDKELVDATATEAYCPIAQIIDSANAQNSSKSGSGKFVFDSGKDDGDGMPESFTKSGSKRKWDASIYSDNMPDGPANLVLLVFDEAGNVNGVKYNVMVANNAPRIAKLHLGTDLDKNNEYSANEFETYNILGKSGSEQKVFEFATAGFAEYAQDAAGKWQENASAPARKAFTAKNGLAVCAEIVGGNGDVNLVFNNADTTTETDGHQTADTVLSGTNRNGDISGRFWDLKGKLASDGANQKVSFTFWDSTEKTTSGLNSLYAFIRVTDLNVDQTDKVAPNVVVDPFFWEGEGEGKNSLYKGSKANGHIELEADLPADTFKDSSGEYDRDPKVSGKIVLRGTAFDETLLKSLSFSMTDFNDGAVIAVSEYVNGVWTNKVPNAIGTNYYEVTVTNEYLNQSGHKVNWEIAIDTAHLKDTTKLDAMFTVIANDDAATAHSSSDTANAASGRGEDGTTDATKHKPTYKMDVVPYITKLYTALADSAGVEFARSATGRYVVRENESVKLYGFNLKAERNAVKIGSATVTPTAGGTDSDGNYLTLPIGTNSSGAVSITVNSVESLNNANKNPNFTSPTDDSITAVEYNSQADGTANNRLTDDVSLWVWKLGAFDNAMNTTNITSPMMKFDAAGNYYISYGNGSNLFAIEKNGTSTDLEMCYNKYHNTNVAFDSDGNFYGVATNTDRVSSEVGGATSFTFFSRKLGQIGQYYEGYGYYPANSSETTAGNYTVGSNKRRLELSQYGGSDGTYNINRVQRPKLTVSGSRNSANVYMAYYDASANNVKFRYGIVTGEESLTGNQRTQYSRNSKMSGGIASDLTGNGTDNSSAAGYHLIADGSTGFKPGAYTAVGYTSSGAAVVAWYDASARRLVYSYNDAPGTAVTSTSSTTNTWQKNAVYLDSAYTGWYVDLAVDGANGVHIAYYNSKSGDLKYAYLKDYNKPTEAVTVTVDSYLSVGTNITINVRDEGTDVTDETTNETTHTANYVPYIYYYNTSSNQTMNSIKVAWRNDMETLRAGAIDDKFTGAWESMTVPTENIPVDATVCGGVPTNGTYSSTVVLGYMTDVFYEKAYIKK